MKLLVAIKRVVDGTVPIRIQPDGSDVALTDMKMGINPFCEIAVEEGVRLREAGVASELVVVTCGPLAAAEQLRHALALGADRALHYVTDETLTPLAVARALRHVCEQERPDLVLLGKQSIDSGNGQVAPMLAALNEWPLACSVCALRINGEELQVTRDIEGGQEIRVMPLPAVVSADLRLNQPRFASLPNVMKARRKPLVSIPFTALAVAPANQIRLLGVMSPPVRRAGVMVNSVDELVDKLTHEAKVL